MYDFFKILDAENLYNRKDHNRTLHSYSVGTNTIQFFGVEDESKVRGPRRDFLFINECNNIPYETFKQLNLRTLSTTFLDYNPVQEFWVHQYLLNREDVGYIHSTYLDNLDFTPKKVIDELNRMKENDPNGYLVYALGKTGTLEGLIFNNWYIEQDNSLFNSEKKIYALDFGFTNDPSCLLSVSSGKDRSLYIDELFYERGLTNPDISTYFEQNNLKKHQDVIYADSSEPKSIQELYQRGWNVLPAVKGPDSILKGIDFLKQYKLFISARSLNLIKELRGYQWMKDRDGKYTNRPVGVDHAIDCLRYGVTSLNILASTFKVGGKLILH